MRKHLRNYALGYILIGLWLLTWLAQWYCEVMLRANEDGASPTLQFWAHTLENWQSEFLQVSVLVIATKYFVFKGSPESKEPPWQD